MLKIITCSLTQKLVVIRFKRFFEKLIEGVLLISSSLSALIVLLIILFLFREGFSLFNTSPLEGENIVVVNKNNTVNNLSARQIKDIFDQSITHWNSVGGKNDSIILLSINDITAYFSEEEIGENFEFLPAKLDSLVAITAGILAVYPRNIIFVYLNCFSNQRRR